MTDLDHIADRLAQILHWLAYTRTRVSPALTPDRTPSSVLGQLFAVQAELCRFEALVVDPDPTIDQLTTQLTQVIAESYAKSDDLKLALDKVHRLQEENRRLRTSAHKPGER